MSIKICLLGSLPKGDEVRKSWKDWKIEYKKILVKIPNLEFSDGDTWVDETRPFELVGHDSNLIKTADIIIVNAENKLGAGTSQEIIIAKYFHKPVITVLPKNTHHRKSDIIFNGTKINDWIHPFIFVLSDLIVENLNESIIWINEFIKNPADKKIKDIKIIDEAINTYLSQKS